MTYKAHMGGVTAFTAEQFVKVNGYSNKFSGWGGEDDDMWNRYARVFSTINQNISCK
jgi:predicted glycosyltransferase involved in capsule biosynthesis